MVKRWIVVGALAMAGLQFALSALAWKSGLRTNWAALAAPFASAFTAGLLMVAHATLRPLREPLVAGVAVAAMGIARWLVGLHGEHPLWMVGISGVVVVGAVAGGMVGRQLAVRAPGPGLTLVLAGAVTMGVAVTSSSIRLMLGDSLENELLLWLIGVGVIAGASALTQSVVPVRRIWLCGLGTLGLVAVGALRQHLTAELVLGAVVVSPLGALGARIAWRYTGARAPATPDVPDARAR